MSNEKHTANMKKRLNLINFFRSRLDPDSFKNNLPVLN